MVTRRQTRSSPGPSGAVADLRVHPIVCVPGLLREFGVEPMTLLRGAGIDPGTLGDPENRVSFASVGRLLLDAAAATGRPDFGLLVGERAGAAVLGLVGKIALHSRNVRVGLRALIVHFHLHDRGAVPMVTDRGGREVELAYLVHSAWTPGIELIADGAMAIAYHLMRGLCGPRWTPTAVSFAHKRPANTAQYRKLFKAPLRFDMPRSAIVFDRHWLDEPIAGSDHWERDRIEERLSSLEAAAPSSASQHVRNALARMVVGDSPSADRIASALGTTRRTLYRRLAEEGTTVGALRNSVRSELAQQLLRNTRMSLAEIAEALDYSEATAFSRAFRGWTGMAPSDFRARAAKG